MTDSITEQPLDLRWSIRALRRHWVVFLGLVVLGFLGGGLLSLRQGPTFVSEAGVLLPPSALDAKGRPVRNIVTESRIAGSTDILTRAGKLVNPPIPPSALRKRVTVSPVGSDILEIRVRATSARDAAVLADAVAKEYVAFSNGSTSDEADASVGVLQTQAAELQSQITRLDGEIATGTARLVGLDPRSPEAVRQVALIDSQRSSQVDAARQLSTINTRIADARLNAQLSRRGLRVIEPATRPSRPSLYRLLFNVGLGGLAGLVSGVTLALAREHRDRRLRRRDDIADAIGAPVLISVDVSPRKRVRELRYLLERWSPSAVESLALRQALSAITSQTHEEPVSVPTGIVVITIPGDHAALALAIELAVVAATPGTPTALLIGTAHGSSAHLRSAAHLVSRTESPRRPDLKVLDAVRGVEAHDLEGARLFVRVVSADCELSVRPAPESRNIAILAVSAGFATAETLAAAALSWLDAGHPVWGVLVANPDSNDPTTGRRSSPLNGNWSANPRSSAPPATYPTDTARLATSTSPDQAVETLEQEAEQAAEPLAKRVKRVATEANGAVDDDDGTEDGQVAEPVKRRVRRASKTSKTTAEVAADPAIEEAEPPFEPTIGQVGEGGSSNGDAPAVELRVKAQTDGGPASEPTKRRTRRTAKATKTEAQVATDTAKAQAKPTAQRTRTQVGEDAGSDRDARAVESGVNGQTDDGQAAGSVKGEAKRTARRTKAEGVATEKTAPETNAVAEQLSVDGSHEGGSNGDARTVESHVSGQVPHSDPAEPVTGHAESADTTTNTQAEVAPDKTNMEAEVEAPAEPTSTQVRHDGGSNGEARAVELGVSGQLPDGGAP
ncbi:MAG: hypothetical protein LC808_27240 [Actinobacteria bacterium]|nr:hypothetical protein [Actinomycetota bacterium]